MLTGALLLEYATQSSPHAVRVAVDLPSGTSQVDEPGSTWLETLGWSSSVGGEASATAASEASAASGSITIARWLVVAERLVLYFVG